MVAHQGAVVTGTPNTSPTVTVQFIDSTDNAGTFYQMTQQVSLNASGAGIIWVSSAETATIEDMNIDGTISCTATEGSS